MDLEYFIRVTVYLVAMNIFFLFQYKSFQSREHRYLSVLGGFALAATALAIFYIPR